MKKHKAFFILLFVLIFITSAIGLVYVNRHRIDNYLFFLIDARLDYEHASEVGDEFGKLTWQDLTYQVNHYKSGNKLEYAGGQDKTKTITLLNSVKRFKFTNDKFYIIAAKGYAVIDCWNVAKIYTSEEKVFLKDVHYIESFEDFDKEDQEVFKRLML